MVLRKIPAPSKIPTKERVRTFSQYCLDQLVLVGNELFYLGVGLVVGVATLAITIVPCVHHLRDFE
jgi:hypothetical protein